MDTQTSGRLTTEDERNEWFCNNYNNTRERRKSIFFSAIVALQVALVLNAIFTYKGFMSTELLLGKVFWNNVIIVWWLTVFIISYLSCIEYFRNRFVKKGHKLTLIGDQKSD